MVTTNVDSGPETLREAIEKMGKRETTLDLIQFNLSDTYSFSRGWNGTLQGKLLETGVYVWILKAVDELTGAPIEKKGTATLLR